jgi:hypothetical protein
MGVYESYSKIKQSAEDMNAAWGRTKEVWTDEKSKQFEKEFIERLSIEIKKAETVLGNMGMLLSNIRSEFKE